MTITGKRAKRRKLTSLSQGRPPTVRQPATSLSSRATRTIIRSHHTLQKQLTRATRDGDTEKAEALQESLNVGGGLKKYQDASMTGQSNARGGDSSKVLMEWLKPVQNASKAANDGEKLHLLEVGALSCHNACSRSKLFDIVRIDLHSQDGGILQQDFMERPLPESDHERFDVISLSLVVNFVPEAAARGEMLRRTVQFLRDAPQSAGEGQPFPALFLVLPLSCISNARYMDDTRLMTIMESLGYARTQRKLSTKLAYYLWSYNPSTARKQTFRKTEVNPGRTRNNFAIIIT